MTGLDATAADIAQRLGVPVETVDAFVFRRIDGGRMVGLGGLGRAGSWAGQVELHLDAEPVAGRAWEARRPERVDAPLSARVFGPYWARSSVVVPVRPDHLVVFGSRHRLGGTGDTLHSLAERLIARVGAVSPAKRLADELELMYAVRRATATGDTDVRRTAGHIVEAAATALSCELGVLWLPDADVLAVADRAPAPLDLDHRALRAMMVRLADDVDALPVCQQHHAARPLPEPLGAGSGVVSWFAVALDGPAAGLLVLCHLQSEPRGFTQLCQQIGARIAEAAAVPLAAALAHERLRDELDRASAQARRDALTGVANRRRWQEAVEACGAPARDDVAIVMLDVDCLKRVNDERGHRVGDDVLRAVAAAIEQSTDDDALVARVGGDEFAVLLVDTDPATTRATVEGIRAAIVAIDTVPGQRVTASIGWADCSAVERIDEAIALADHLMYEAKRARTGS